MKKCTQCLEIKSLDEYYKDKHKSDGRTVSCKECQKAAAKQKYAECANYRRRAKAANKTKDQTKQKYNCQKWKANLKNIPWLFTFEEWYKVWIDSGHWDNRGRKANEYCMARIKDVGPYSVNNVKIVKCSVNCGDANRSSEDKIICENSIPL